MPRRRPPASCRTRTTKDDEAFGGVGYHVTETAGLTKALAEALDNGKPTLINAVIDPEAGTESGHIQNLNATSSLQKKK